jgi:hypothetical protein
MTALTGGSDHITDFMPDAGDKIVLNNVLTGFDPAQSAIDDFVISKSAGGSTRLSIDADGAGTESHPVHAAILDHMPSFDVQQMLASENLVIIGT